MHTSLTPIHSEATSKAPTKHSFGLSSVLTPRHVRQTHMLITRALLIRLSVPSCAIIVCLPPLPQHGICFSVDTSWVHVHWYCRVSYETGLTRSAKMTVFGFANGSSTRSQKSGSNPETSAPLSSQELSICCCPFPADSVRGCLRNSKKIQSAANRYGDVPRQHCLTQGCQGQMTLSSSLMHHRVDNG